MKSSWNVYRNIIPLLRICKAVRLQSEPFTFAVQNQLRMKRSFNLVPIQAILLLLTLFITTSLTAQTIKGIVSDSSGKPLAGATIELKGSTATTQTNAEGNFSFTAPKNLTRKDVLTISYSGYKELEWYFYSSNNFEVYYYDRGGPNAKMAMPSPWRFTSACPQGKVDKSASTGAPTPAPRG